MPSAGECSACRTHGVACLEHTVSPPFPSSGIFLKLIKILTISSPNAASTAGSPSVQASSSTQLPTRCSEVTTSSCQQDFPSNQMRGLDVGSGIPQRNESSTDRSPPSASSMHATGPFDQRPDSFTARDSTKLNILASASMDPRLQAALTPPPKSPYEQSDTGPSADDQLPGEKMEARVKEEGKDGSQKHGGKSETLEPNTEVKKYQSRKVTEAGRSKLFPPAWKKPPGV